MKVKELIKYLQHSDQESLVVLSCDPEGNRYSPLDCASDGYLYIENENTIYSLKDDKEYLEEIGELEEVKNKGQKAQVFWPIR